MTRNLRFVNRMVIVLCTAAVSTAASAQTPAGRTGQPVTRDYAAELACSAQATTLPPDNAVRVGEGREHGKSLFGPGDPIIVKGGTSQGIKAGQDYFVRRVVADRFARPGSDKMKNYSIHTAGWIHIEDAQSDTSIATVVKVCDGIMQGDYLEPYVKPVLPTEVLGGEPDFSDPGHLVLGDDRRQMGGTGDLMVVDRGSDHGIKAGQRFTIFRQTAGGAGPVAKIGEATAMAVNPETTVVRIEKVVDAVVVGDLVAIHR
jgi:hypothetical protein